MFTVDVEISDPLGVEGWLSGVRAQIPYACALAINDTVNAAQKAIQRSIPSHFIERRAAFVENTIYRGRGDFATKDNLAGVVRVNPARNMLVKHEDGGSKVATGHSTLGIPLVRLDDPTLIIGSASELNLKHVMSLVNSQGGHAVGPFKRGKRGQTRAAAEFFVRRGRNGFLYVDQRVGAVVRALWTFRRQVPLKPRLAFEQTAYETALAAWDACAAAALAKAIDTAR